MIEMILPAWFAALTVLGLVVVVTGLDVRRIAGYRPRHARVAGAHRVDPNGGWWL